MDASILKTLKRIRKEAPRRYADLRNTCDEIIAQLSAKDSISTNTGGGSSSSNANDVDADKYFAPLQAACESRQPRLMEIALDGIHYLIEHGYLRGKRKLPPSTANVDTGRNQSAGSKSEDGDDRGSVSRRSMMDLIIETVNRCSEEFDEGVQVQVIKALLVAVTSSHCEVHEASLLLAVRACFHIHLISKNQVNKTTAKAALTQMLSVVNQRMESFDARAKAETEATLSEIEAVGISESTSVAYSETLLRDTGNTGSFATHRVVSETEAGSDASSVPETMMLKEHGGQSKGEHGGHSTTTSMSSSVREKESVGLGMAFPSILHKDAFLIFRALCKLSMKGLHESDDSGTPSDPIALQNKVLSLELILHILQNSGTAFRTGERFIYAIRNYLCVSLLGNCTSQVAQVVGLSLQIFVALLDGFKDHLKSEVEVFITTIFLRILESENSTYDHKLRVLEVFHRICFDASALVEIFINYDCDMDAIDLFRRIVDSFAKIAKNPSLPPPPSRGSVDFISSAGAKRAAADEQQHIRLMGLKGTVIVLQALLRAGGMWDTVPAEIVEGAKALLHGADESYYSPIKSGVVLNQLQSPDSGTPGNGISPDSDGGANMADVEVGDSKSMSIVDSFDRKQKAQEDIETGILKFNLSPKKGLAFLAERNHIEMTPVGVAQFLHQYQERLDKTSVGEYLGREREYEGGFCLKVLHEYVGLMDFSSMAFDLAIRYFLGGFRLPGEAQKIDRLMEKFAERYYLQNQDIFASADMAFILAFSTIMLQTNLHNPAIRDDKRMTKDQFIRQNKGISSDGELSDEMLIEIYDRIAAQPISMTQDEKQNRRIKKDNEAAAAQFNVFQLSTDRRRKEAFNDERKEMVRNGEAMFRQAKKGNAFVRNLSRSSEAYVRPMFEVAWAPILGVLSQILETAEDHAVVQICLTGMYYAIRLACRLDFPTARHTFMNALAKFTTLDTVREMHSKHVSCIKLMLTITLTESDFLDESWGQVLQFISQLARLQLFANRVLTDDAFFSETASNSVSDYFASVNRSNTNKRTSSAPIPSPFSGFSWQGATDRAAAAQVDPFAFSKLFSGPSRAETARQVEESNAALLMREINPLSLDKIFLESNALGSEGVYHFVRCLCDVSMLEISSTSCLNNLRAKEISGDTANPRIFSLQKLVEVADVNMYSRPRIEWSRIWSLLADHFTAVGMHENLPLAMFAVDSLKQLSIKFLQKEELSNFNFQRVFLKPFESILIKSKSNEIKDLILRCIDVLVRACAMNIRSGWRSIFATFEAAAVQDSFEVATVAFDIAERLLKIQFDLLVYDFVELMNCLVAFVASAHTPLSLRALDHLSRCADYLADGSLQPAIDLLRSPVVAASVPSSAEIDSDNNRPSVALTPSVELGQAGELVVNEDALVFRFWWPLLLGLSSHVADSRVEVRSRALSTLTDVLKSYGGQFSSQTWDVIFKGILFPMVDSAKTDIAEQTVSPILVLHSGAALSSSSSTAASGNSWIATMCYDVLAVCILMYDTLRGLKSHSPMLLQDLVQTIEGCICQEREGLARIGLRALEDVTKLLDVAATADAMDLLCSKLHNIAMSNLCKDFGTLGSVVLSEKDMELISASGSDEDGGPIGNLVSTSVVSLLTDSLCPLAYRRRSMVSSTESRGTVPSSGASESIVTVYMTPFGPAKMSEALPGRPTAVRQYSLSWGATLYSSNEFSPASVTVVAPGTSQRTATANITLDNSAWDKKAGAVMTSMIVSLHMSSLISEFLLAHVVFLKIVHMDKLLTALEAQYWHARCFNDNLPLRTQLKNRSFMQRGDDSGGLPHLLEQEVQTVSRILRTVFDVYSSAKNSSGGVVSYLELDTFAGSWVSRVCRLVCTRYVVLEEELDPKSTNRSNWSGRKFATQLHSAYTPIVTSVVNEVVGFSRGQFSRNAKWIVPILSQLILSEDKTIRAHVSDIYTRHINANVLVAIYNGTEK